jgi:hypothetical protein
MGVAAGRPSLSDVPQQVDGMATVDKRAHGEAVAQPDFALLGKA